MTNDFVLQKVPEKSQKVPKNANNWLKSAQKCRQVLKEKARLHSIGATIRTAKRVGVSRMRDLLYLSSNLF